MSIIFDKIRMLLNKKFSFDFNQIELETKFEAELGVDSREMIELINELEIVFKITINLDDIDKIVKEGRIITVKDVVNYIADKKGIN
jgi:acyl carrier protein